ncbi:MAG: hypothetical protein COB67_05335 [SAR324 cluster bacterium]|uniref:histidine kinase n=1 Tax=SAR324 cluster bacterium TaxID=2024889 RepID=A0A2A4T6A3_9DELT|nr:MAG: hypothetical protein COB67_05335 [SAR324 cluster bacterium]
MMIASEPISTAGEDIFFVEEPSDIIQTSQEKEGWKIIIADDDEEIHHITKLVLADFQFDHRPLQFFSAYSAEEARQMLFEHPNTAMILLDVVMETDNAGLEIVRFIREKLDNHLIQIILRTGQPGQAPEQEVISKYAINNYKSKSELTSQKLHTAVTTSLRAFQLSNSISQLNQDLQRQLEERKTVEHALQEELSIRKKAEKAAILAQKAKAEVLADMSHEFRTPLVGIQGFADLGLAKIKRGNLTEVQMIDFFTRIKKSGADLMQMLNTLLDLSKLESGKISFELEERDLLEIIEEAIKEFHPALHKKGIHLHLETSQVSTRAYCDHRLIGQVVRNLLSNAINFTTEHQTIGVRFQEYNLGEGSRHFVQVSIINFGVGIPDDELEVIFDKFVQSSKTQNYALGQGLGLSICKEIIESHQGKIWAETTKSGETIFNFTLPRLPSSIVTS